jgi:hypothetical protein
MPSDLSTTLFAAPSGSVKKRSRWSNQVMDALEHEIRRLTSGRLVQTVSLFVFMTLQRGNDITSAIHYNPFHKWCCTMKRLSYSSGSDRHGSGVVPWGIVIYNSCCVIHLKLQSLNHFIILILRWLLGAWDTQLILQRWGSAEKIGNSWQLIAWFVRKNLVQCIVCRVS